MVYKKSVLNIKYKNLISAENDVSQHIQLIFFFFDFILIVMIITLKCYNKTEFKSITWFQVFKMSGIYIYCQKEKEMNKNLECWLLSFKPFMKWVNSFIIRNVQKLTNSFTPN